MATSNIQPSCKLDYTRTVNWTTVSSPQQITTNNPVQLKKLTKIVFGVNGRFNIWCVPDSFALDSLAQATFQGDTVGVRWDSANSIYISATSAVPFKEIIQYDLIML